MQYVVTEMGPGMGWTPDNLAASLRSPLAAIGVEVVRETGMIEGGLRGSMPTPEAYKAKFDEVGRVVRRVIKAGPPGGYKFP